METTDGMKISAITPATVIQSLVPEHDGGNVADWRESTTRVGCDDDEGSINHAILVVGDELTQNHNHHDTGGQIVEDC